MTTNMEPEFPAKDNEVYNIDVCESSTDCLGFFRSHLLPDITVLVDWA